MGPHAERQAEIERRRMQAAHEYPALWSKMIADWRRPADGDRAWLLYAANYLFQTGGVRWALDPLTLKQRVPETSEMDIARGLEGLAFILLTHRHKDHFNPELIRALSKSDALWVVPGPLLPLVEAAGLDSRKVIGLHHLEQLALNGLNVTPFNGLHWENDNSRPEGKRGVPATGYLVECNGKRWLFPGDTRTYAANQLPAFGPVDILFAHLWLGRGAALQFPAPLLEDFCGFCLALQPKRIVLTHLNEWGRRAEDFWGLEHSAQAISAFKKQAPHLPVEAVCTGDKVALTDP